jgi:hypothetical protein
MYQGCIRLHLPAVLRWVYIPSVVTKKLTFDCDQICKGGGGLMGPRSTHPPPPPPPVLSSNVDSCPLHTFL